MTRQQRAKRRSAKEEESSEIGLLQFRQIVDSIRDYAILSINPEGRILTWNCGAERLLGYRSEEVRGRNYSVLFVPEDLANALPDRERSEAAATGRFEAAGWRLRKDGTRVWANEIVQAIRDSKGGLIGFTNVLRDLTERKTAEGALRQSEERHRLVVENIEGYAIFMLHKDGVISSWNRGVERVLGYREDEFVGRPGAIIFSAEDQQNGEPEKEYQRAAQFGQTPDERWHVRKDGSLFWASGIMNALRDCSGTLIGFAKVLRDNTERKQAQDALEAAHAELESRVVQRTLDLSNTVALLEKEVAERQALEGALLRAIDDERQRFGQELHDGLCQHLAGTGLLAGTLANRLAAAGITEAAEVRAIGDLVSSAADQARSLAKGLHPVTIASGGFCTALRELAAGLSHTVRCHVECPAPIEVDQQTGLHLYRIAQEAITNALKHAHANRIIVAVADRDGTLVLTVTDDGCGFDRASIEQGMGILNMHHRAKVIGASLIVESQVGDGTRVICELPDYAAGE